MLEYYEVLDKVLGSMLKISLYHWLCIPYYFMIYQTCCTNQVGSTSDSESVGSKRLGFAVDDDELCDISFCGDSAHKSR